MFKSLSHLNPIKFFVVIAVFFELLFNMVTPPLQAPDEFSHFYRAYQVSQGQFLPVKTDQRVGGYMPQGLIDFSTQHKNSAYALDYTVDYAEIFNSCKIKLQEEQLVFCDFSGTAFYSPVSYLPQAFIMVLLKPFTEIVGVYYYVGRLFTFLVWLLCMCFIIKTLPVFKWLFSFLMLLPMHLYQVNSFSADIVTNILALMFLAIVLKHTFVTPVIKRKHLLMLALLAGSLVLAKFVYIGVLLSLLMIPVNKFASKSSRYISLGLLYSWSLLIVILWSGAVMKFYIPIKDYNINFQNVSTLSPCGDYEAQKAYILQHRLYFFKVIYNSIFVHPTSYLKGYIGFLGNSDIPLPNWLHNLAYFILIVTALVEPNKFSLTVFQKGILFCSAMSSFVLLLLSIHLAWDCVGEGIVDFVQGEYLIPLFPFLFLLFDNRFREIKFNPALMILPLILLLNGYSCKVIAARYFIGNTHTLKEYKCDLEKTQDAGQLQTSVNDIFLGGADNRSKVHARSGQYSALLSPASPFALGANFKDIRPGDIIEVEAWEKNKGALIVISGNGEKGCSFYFGGTFNSFRDKDGWLRLKNIYHVPATCKNPNVSIYLWNPGKENVYIDDLKVTVKRPTKP